MIYFRSFQRTPILRRATHFLAPCLFPSVANTTIMFVMIDYRSASVMIILLFSWEKVLNEGYWVSDKTDGTRFLLMIVPAKTNPHLEGFLLQTTQKGVSSYWRVYSGIYFVDRKFSFYRVKGMDFLIQLYAVDGVTLLDGEMVHHIGTHFAFFVPFYIPSLVLTFNW